MKNLVYITILLLALCFSCREESIDTQTVRITDDPIEILGYDPEVRFVRGNVFGEIIDEHNNPVNSVEISVSGQTTTTNEFGVFTFKNLEMNEFGTLVSANKEGFVEGSRLIFPNEGEESRLKIQLITEDESGLINSDTGGIIELDNGAQVIFESNSFAFLDGTEYTGNVSVIAKYLDPTNPTTIDEMPGALIGIRPFQANEEVALTTFGMVLVELESEAGQELNLIDNSEAEIRLPIPANLISNAPNEIPLWFFNDDIGRWVEEGEAVIANGFYVGKVNHFTFWNCDVPWEQANLELNISNQDGLPFAHENIIIRTSNSNLQLSGYTNKNGFLEGPVPANIPLSVIIMDICGDVLHTENLNSIGQDSEINFSVNESGYEETIVKGNVNCSSGQGIQDMMLVVTIGDETKVYPIDTDFNFRLNICPDLVGTVTVKAVDLESLAESPTFIISIEEENNLPLIDVCSQDMEEYIILDIDGQSLIFPDVSSITASFTDPGFTQITGKIDDFEINLIFHGVTAGDYSGQVTQDGHTFHQNTVGIPLNGNRGDGLFENFTVTAYGDVGEFIIGSFEGVVVNTQGIANEFNVKGTFKVKVEDNNYDGTYVELISDGIRVVRPQVFGSVDLTTGRLLSNNALNTTIQIHPDNQGGHELAVAFLADLNFSLLLETGSDELDDDEQEVTNFGNIGERVTGYADGIYHDLFRDSDLEFYLEYNILRK